MKRNVRTALLAAALTLGAGCKKPSVGDVESWISAGQFSKVTEFVVNLETPLAERVAAIEKLVEFGQTTEFQVVLGELKDRDAVTAAVKEVLLKRLETDDKRAEIKAKDALFVLLPYVEEKERDLVLGAVAAWALGGLDANTPRAALIKRVEDLQLPGQIQQLGHHGVPVASWLIAHGVETNSLTPFLAETATTPELQRTVLDGIRRLFALPDLEPPWGVLDAARRFPLPETVDFLVSVYLNENFDGAARSSALGAAQDLLDGRGADDKKLPSITDTREKKAVVLGALKRLMASPLATDRWDAATMMLGVDGTQALDAALDGLRADITLYSWQLPNDDVYLPDYAVAEVCKRWIEPHKDAARPILESWLVKGDRMQKSVTALCLKRVGNADSATKLLALATDTTSVEELFFPGGNESRREAIAAGTITALTVGSLAQNAAESLLLLADVAAAEQAKTLTPENAAQRREAIQRVFAYTGDHLKAAVERVATQGVNAADANDAPALPPAPTPPKP